MLKFVITPYYKRFLEKNLKDRAFNREYHFSFQDIQSNFFSSPNRIMYEIPKEICEKKNDFHFSEVQEPI